MKGNGIAIAISHFRSAIDHFWEEWSAAGSRWRTRVEHVQSGQAIAFTDMKQMAEFMRPFVGIVIGREENAQPQPKNVIHSQYRTRIKLNTANSS